jgi:cathepsin A (carboxypeptidase C)
MRLYSTLALGAAIVAAGQWDQQVLGGNSDVYDSNANDPAKKDFEFDWITPLAGSISGMSSEAKELWDEISKLMPDAVKSFKETLSSAKPKLHTRKPDRSWDSVLKGSDVQDQVGVNGNSEHKMTGGNLENYSLRAKKVDPSSLGVDTVKQYSGYLDDESSDKHLFFCKTMPMVPVPIVHINT